MNLFSSLLRLDKSEISGDSYFVDELLVLFIRTLLILGSYSASLVSVMCDEQQLSWVQPDRAHGL